MFNSTAYRYPNERLILLVTMLLFVLVIALTAAATVCVSAVFVLGTVMLSYNFSRRHHEILLQRAQRVTPETIPVLAELAHINSARLQVEPVDIFIVPNRTLNAYTFGLAAPKSIVLHSKLFDVMDKDEIQFILGHEMGHVCLGHTWLNSLVGGMAGIPASISAAIILEMALRSWGRACEYSADRAGLLACGKPHKAISALVKLETGEAAYSRASLERALQRIESEDNDLGGSLGELLATHPMIINRIEQLRQYARTQQFQHLLARMDQQAA